MKGFAALYAALDSATATSAKQRALRRYFAEADAADAAWAVYFLSGGKPRQLVPTAALKEWTQEAAGIPAWLFDESYEAVGDLAETMALLLPPPSAPQQWPLHRWLTDHLLPLRGLDRPTQGARVRALWQALPADQRLVTLKLITGSWRVGVSKLSVTQALAAEFGVDAKRVAQRLMGYTQAGATPSAADFAALIAAEAPGDDALSGGQPYPFFLAHALHTPLPELPAQLGEVGEWLAEWKWDGIRAQVVRREGQCWIWSRGEELITERFPELAQAALAAWPDGTVVDGEVVIAAADAGVRPFADLQQRIGRKTVGAKLQRDLPAALIAYDLLEQDGSDVRSQPQAVRREALEGLMAGTHEPALRLSPSVQAADWPALAEQRASARARGSEGLMLKHRSAAYGVGRTKDVGTWWKWKLDPMSVDAVLIYAQRGHGRRASLYSDYTFAVWSGPPDDAARSLVPFAKAYSGLTDAEMAQVDAIIRRTTRERFGPVCSVEPTLVFELGFEGIGASARHKSGIAVRFPRMLRWRQDKPVAEADTLAALRALIDAQVGAQ